MINQKISKVSNTVAGTFGTLQSLTNIAKGVLCLPSLLSQFKGINLKAIMGNVGSFAVSVLSSLKDIVQDQINYIIAGALIDLVDPIRAILGDIQDTLAQFNELRDQIDFEVQDLVDNIKNQQNCIAQGASLFNCVAQLAVNNISKKDVRDLNGSVDLITQKIEESTAGAQGAISSVVTRELKFADKLRQAIHLQ